MYNRFFTSLFILCVLSLNVSASNNPFAKNKSLTVGTDVKWNVDKQSSIASKTKSDGSGVYYHLKFNNKELELLISDDANGEVAKNFTQLEIKQFVIDGKQSPLFNWCLNNQERHSRFLQQGLSVKKDVCIVDGNAGRFVMRLNKATLAALQNGSNLSILVKPYRTPVELKYDISDFKEMHQALNTKPASMAIIPVLDNKAAVADSKCWAKPPAKYTKIKAIEYSCADMSAKNSAEAKVLKQVNQEKEHSRKLAAQRAAEQEKQRKIAEDKRLKEREAKLKQEELLKAEAAAIAASEAKQAKISNEISQKMIGMCSKFWNKGEHRCYCQKYVEHAPENIQQNASCE